jgi:hypothetical protein
VLFKERKGRGEGVAENDESRHRLRSYAIDEACVYLGAWLTVFHSHE